MEVKISINAAFWFAYAVFCIIATIMAEFVGVIPVSEMSRGQHVIFISSLIASGILMRRWMRERYKNGVK